MCTMFDTEERYFGIKFSARYLLFSATNVFHEIESEIARWTTGNFNCLKRDSLCGEHWNQSKVDGQQNLEIMFVMFLQF